VESEEAGGDHASGLFIRLNRKEYLEMQSTHIVGIDPGIVHTGVVEMNFYPRDREITVQHEVVLGTDAAAVRDWIYRVPSAPGETAPVIFIEGFRARSNLGHDREMTEAVAAMKQATKGQVLDNMGIKKVVRTEVLKLLGVWQFATPTHHQDLRSAARIAVLGMLKDPDLNRLLADVVRDHLDGRTWDVS
jgi:hypothetical protein